MKGGGCKGNGMNEPGTNRGWIGSRIEGGNDEHDEDGHGRTVRPDLGVTPRGPGGISRAIPINVREKMRTASVLGTGKDDDWLGKARSGRN